MKKQANNIGIIANDEAIKYAKLKYSKYHKDSVYEKDIAETETDFARGFITGFRYVTQWNSLDEKPQKEKFHHSTSKPCIINYDNLWIGYYDYLKEEIYLAYNIDNMIETNYYVKLSEIDGWQYLPEIK